MHLTYLPWWAGDSAGYALPAWAVFIATLIGLAFLRARGLALAVAALGSILTFCVLAEYCYRYSLPLLPIFIICTAYVIESCCLAVTAYRARVDRIPS